MESSSTTIVPATPASALVFGDSFPAAVSAFGASGSGEQIVHIRRLQSHQQAGFSYNLNGPNCAMRWAHVPASLNGPVDVVVHLHGYKGHNQMQLRAKLAASGLDLGSPGVAGPTLGLVPHGHPFASSTQGQDGFDFPAISTKAQLDQFIDDALTELARITQTHPTRGRVTLTGHSGGGAALNVLMQAMGAQPGVLGFEYFDATYGQRQQPNARMLAALRTWIDAAIGRDLALAGGSAGDAARQRLDAGGGHVRICFIAGSGTDPTARAADRLMAACLQTLVPDAGLRALMRQRYRAQLVADPRRVGHSLVARTFGGRLLADPADDLSPDAQDLPAAAPPRAPARGHGFSEGEEEWGEEEGGAGTAGVAWQSRAEVVSAKMLRAPDRADDAPTGAEFIRSLGNRQGEERENRIFEQLRAGNMPASLRTFYAVRTTAKDRAGNEKEIEYWVTPDVLMIGSESESVRIPVDPVTAQRLADHFRCLLPTARMVEQIYQAATKKQVFIYGGYADTPRAHLQIASSAYLDHSRKIDAKLHHGQVLSAVLGLTAGHKKELVITDNYFREGKAKLAYYGAHDSKGKPTEVGEIDKKKIRDKASVAHAPWYVDYSHGVRLVWPKMKVAGAERDVAEVLRHTDDCLLLAREGLITSPRYTLDRKGKLLSAGSQAAGYDPLGLSPAMEVEPLGYGTSWDERLRPTVEGFLASFMAIPVSVGSQTVRVHPPYFMNWDGKKEGPTKKRHQLATTHRNAAPAALRTLLNERRFTNALIGKPTPEMLRNLLEAADQGGLLQADPRVNRQPTPANLRAFLKHYGLGVDCSAFVSQALNKLIDLFPGAAATDRIARPHSTPSGSLKGGASRFDRVTDPTQLCPGDTMWRDGHIRIVCWAERRNDRIVFATAESRSTPNDIGPSVAYWRYIPNSGRAVDKVDFRGWRLERSDDLNAPDRNWARADDNHVFGHFQPLRSLLGRAGVTPTALDYPTPAPAPGMSPPPPPAPVRAPVRAPAPAPAPGPVSPVSRTATTRDLTQDEVNRLAAIRFRNAADIATFFSRSGQAGFIDWYNAGLAHSAPFRDRGATATSRIARDRYTAFWNLMSTAFDRNQITALDFAAFTAISINETGGHLWANPEKSGAVDAQGVSHPGLAYCFDALKFRKKGSKRSYNLLGRTAGWCFNDPDFIAAHGTLAGGAQLAHHGDDWGRVWHGNRYPSPQFSTDEIPATNGFIMQADFYKFRGRGVIQTTARPGYLRAAHWIKGYGGSNPVLLGFKRQWASYTDDVA
jgi:hypothetical protein